MAEPLTDKELAYLDDGQLMLPDAAAEIRELRADKQMLLDNSDELETCVSELKADNSRLRVLLREGIEGIELFKRGDALKDTPNG